MDVKSDKHTHKESNIRRDAHTVSDIETVTQIDRQTCSRTQTHTDVRTFGFAKEE